MKLTRLKHGNYEITTRVRIPDEIKRFYNATETGFSPNPFAPVIMYEIPDKEPGLQSLIDYILDNETGKRT